MSLATLVLTILHAPVWIAFAAALSGVCVVNYQCLVTLQRIMKPLIARDNARRGRTGTNWRYESMYGRTGVVLLNLLTLGIVVATVMLKLG